MKQQFGNPPRHNFTETENTWQILNHLWSKLFFWIPTIWYKSLFIKSLILKVLNQPQYNKSLGKAKIKPCKITCWFQLSFGPDTLESPVERNSGMDWQACYVFTKIYSRLPIRRASLKNWMMYTVPKKKIISVNFSHSLFHLLDVLTVDAGTDRLSQNVGKELPPYTV
jgi:hypothetical protein